MEASTPNTVRHEPTNDSGWSSTETQNGSIPTISGLTDISNTPAVSSKALPKSLSPETLASVVTERAESQPEFEACVFLADDGSRESLSYGELDKHAREIASQLLQILKPGERALLVYPAGLEFVTAFLGCQYAGIVAVPATHPKPRRPLPRMRQIAEDCDARVALTSRATLDTIDFEKQEPLVRELNWVATDDPNEANAEAFELIEPHEDSLAFLQYTSGSTSEPKGVKVSQKNLAANLEAIRISFGLERDVESREIGVFWLPAYHDMGLIGGVLTPLYVGGTTILMSPGAFLQNPGRWLGAISEYKATISGAPNFAFDYCVRRISPEDTARLDLSNWRLAFSGAEPVRAETLHRFAEAFEPAGFNARAFYPCYGLAESTLLAAGPHHDDNPTLLAVDRASVGTGKVELSPNGCDETTQELVGCGVAPVGHRVLVINPETMAPVPEQSVGEIVLWGPSVTTGYWDRTDLNDTLWATPQGETEQFLRTGDLGFLHEEELFVTGRLKDVIVLRGQNHYPQDIEQTAAEAHTAALPSAAFTLSEGSEEQLAMVVQVDRMFAKDRYDEVARAIRTAVSQTHGLDAATVVLIRQATLPVTSSGKVQRSLTREMYLANELRIVHELKRNKPSAPKAKPVSPAKSESKKGPQSAEQIEAWLEAWLIDRLDLDASELSRDKPFAELGVDSLTAVELSGELEQEFGVPLPPVVAWNYPTPAALSGYLAKKSNGEPDSDTGSDSNTGSNESVATATLEPPVAAGPAADPAEGADAEVESLLAEIEDLSDEEAARLLGE